MHDEIVVLGYRLACSKRHLCVCMCLLVRACARAHVRALAFARSSLCAPQPVCVCVCVGEGGGQKDTYLVTLASYTKASSDLVGALLRDGSPYIC